MSGTGRRSSSRVRPTTRSTFRRASSTAIALAPDHVVVATGAVTDPPPAWRGLRSPTEALARPGMLGRGHRVTLVSPAVTASRHVAALEHEGLRAVLNAVPVNWTDGVLALRDGTGEIVLRQQDGAALQTREGLAQLEELYLG